MNDDELIRDFGLRPVGSTDDLLVHKLEKAVEARFGEPPGELSMRYARDGILEGDGYYYMPVSWIGCCGMLVVKPDFEVVVFGSFVGAATHLWAWLRGVDLEGEAGNDLVVRAVHDERETLRCLKTIWTARYVNNVLKPRLRGELPVRITRSVLYFGIRALRAAETNEWFEFDIEPPTEDDPAAPPHDSEKRRPFS